MELELSGVLAFQTESLYSFQDVYVYLEVSPSKSLNLGFYSPIATFVHSKIFVYSFYKGFSSKVFGARRSWFVLYKGMLFVCPDISS